MVHLILLLAIVGFLVLQIPMPQIFRTAIVGIVCIVVVLYLLQVFGVDTGFRLRLR